MLQVLLWQRATVRRNELLRGSWRKRIGWLAGLILGAGVIYFIYTVSRLIFDWLLRAQPEAVSGLVTGGFTLLTTLALFWGMGSVLTDLYLASDLELLLAAPVSSASIFWLKLLGAMWQNATTASIPISILVAFGVAAKAPVSYYFGAAFVLFLVLAALSALSMALVMLLMRVMPARRAREIYSLLYLIFFAISWLAWMTLSSSGRMAERITEYGPQLAALGNRLTLPPASWAGKMMLAWVAGDWAQVALHAVLLVVIAGVLVGAAFWLFERSFHRDWATMHEVASRARRARAAGPARPARRAPGQVIAAWLPWPARDVAAKDWTVLPRDLRQLGRLIMPLVVSLFYVYQFGVALPLARNVPGLAFWLVLAILPVVPLFFALALGTPAIGKEGTNFELLRVAPVAPGGLLWGKVWMALVPTATIAILATAAVSALLRLTLPQIALLLFLVCFLSGAMCIVSVAMGALVPNFRAVDYRRSVGAVAAYGTMIASAGLWVVGLANLAAIAIRLPANHALALDISRALGGVVSGVILYSVWPLLALLLVDALVAAGLALLWSLACDRLAAWQPTE